MQLSKNYKLSDAVRSQYAARNGIDNHPRDGVIIQNLQRVCNEILEVILDNSQIITSARQLFIGSFYRCPALNRGIGGSSRSYHMKGLAVDIEVARFDNKDLWNFIRAMGSIKYDQLILEFYKNGQPASGWIHLGIAKRGATPRGQVFTIPRQLKNRG